MDIIIWGTGLNGKRCFENYKEKYNVIAFGDNYKKGEFCGKKIVDCQELKSLQYDLIFIASAYTQTVMEQLLSEGVPERMITTVFIDSINSARENFLRSVSETVSEKKLFGSVAEAGVFQGDFAKVINEVFPDRKLYLFDSFEGFSDRDVDFEEDKDKVKSAGHYFENTSKTLVLSKMKYKDNVIIKEGFVPDTFEDIDDVFVFVNLDMDLYLPTKHALEFFWDRMVPEGVILVHDYYNQNYRRLREAVNEFATINSIKLFPIGDLCSVGMIK